ncbi:MAG: serine--tRNA ligase [bacterium]|nr:serine--tRNA ligase [bacterium]
MIDLKWLAEHQEEAERGFRAKRSDVPIARMLELDEERKGLAQKVEAVAAEKNRASKELGGLAPAERKTRLAELKELDTASAGNVARLKEVEGELHELLWNAPNLPLADVPVGNNESENVVLREVGERPTFDFTPKPHWDIGQYLGVIDAERATRVAGARFVYLLGPIVRLQQALTEYVFGVLTNRDRLRAIIAQAGLAVSDTPFVPVVPPLMVTPEVFDKMARLHPREERYHIPSDDVFLIGSAEHTLGPLHMGETLAYEQVPLRYVAATPAFRREAGSYGKDTRGLIRLHQFDKIEMESFTLPEQGVAEQNLLVAVQEHLVASLGIPYRVVQICTGDMGGPDARQIDIECWMPGQEAYRETHTADYMGEYQARRLQTRIRRNDGTLVHAHMNDATAMAIGRTLAAILECQQQQDGSVLVPEVLHPWTGFTTMQAINA